MTFFILQIQKLKFSFKRLAQRHIVREQHKFSDLMMKITDVLIK